MEKCPFFKNEGCAACCPLEKLANPIYAGVAFLGFNLFLILIDVYEIGLITLGSYIALVVILSMIAHIKIMEFLQGKDESKAQEAEIQEKINTDDEEKFQKCFASIYAKCNDGIQVLRKIVLMIDKMLTLKVILILYLTSQIALLLGDFRFFAFLGNVLIMLPLIYTMFGEVIKGVWEQGWKISRENLELVMNRLPKYSDLKNKK